MANSRLARSSEIVHPSGLRLSTPLLVPSFSSKGFAIRREQSEISNYFEVAQSFLTTSVLISAYDIAQGYIPMPDYAKADLTFVDSGGYEISEMHDESAINQGPVKHEEWGEERLKEIYENWPEEIPAVFVSFDKGDEERHSLQEQIQHARDFFTPFSHQMRTILLKSESKYDPIDVAGVIGVLEQTSDFSILGFTEKELGSSLMQRLENIALIRRSMDNRSIQIPIHVFGSLDPIGTVLYFLAGAEIFDGLSWLRYGYRNGVACYRDNMFVLEQGIEESLSDFYSKGIQSNYEYLLKLGGEMADFLRENSFDSFSHNVEFYRSSMESLNTRIGGAG